MRPLAFCARTQECPMIGKQQYLTDLAIGIRVGGGAMLLIRNPKTLRKSESDTK